jgi:hypothetical protein
MVRRSRGEAQMLDIEDGQVMQTTGPPADLNDWPLQKCLVPLAPARRVLEPEIAAPLQRRTALLLVAAHGIDRLVEDLDDVEPVEGAPRRTGREPLGSSGSHLPMPQTLATNA